VKRRAVKMKTSINNCMRVYIIVISFPFVSMKARSSRVSLSHLFMAVGSVSKNRVNFCVKWVTRQHGMARPQVPDGGVDLQI
jgi:hypothetical protein